MTTAQDGGKVIRPTHRRLYPQEMLLVFISVRGWVDPRASYEDSVFWWVIINISEKYTTISLEVRKSLLWLSMLRCNTLLYQKLRRQVFFYYICPTRRKAITNYPQELAQDAVCQSRTGHMTRLWFLPTRPLRLNTNEWVNEWMSNKCSIYLLTIICFL